MLPQSLDIDPFHDAITQWAQVLDVTFNMIKPGYLHASDDVAAVAFSEHMRRGEISQEKLNETVIGAAMPDRVDSCLVEIWSDLIRNNLYHVVHTFGMDFLDQELFFETYDGAETNYQSITYFKGMSRLLGEQLIEWSDSFVEEENATVSKETRIAMVDDFAKTMQTFMGKTDELIVQSDYLAERLRAS